MTTRELLTAEKRAEAATPPSMPHSGESTPFWHSLPIRSLQDMSLVQTIQLTDLLVASIPPPHRFSHSFPYPRISVTSSSISTIPSAAQSASNINFMHLPTLPTSTNQTTTQHNQPTSNNPHSNTLHLSALIPPYPTNLTPVSSNLHSHCATKDRLGRWLPHPNALILVGLPATCELQ